MSSKFYAVNRESGKRWTPDPFKTAHGIHQYLVMYDSGYLAVVERDFYTHITPLKPQDWEVVVKGNMKRGRVK